MGAVRDFLGTVRAAARGAVPASDFARNLRWKYDIWPSARGADRFAKDGSGQK
jgi:hypothetical protein